LDEFRWRAACVLIQKSFGVPVVCYEMRSHQCNWDYDAAERKYFDLVEAGVIDPTKVVRLALENAASAATLLLLSEATLTEVRDEKSNAIPHFRNERR